MKITTTYLRQVIKEEIENLMEATFDISDFRRDLDEPSRPISKDRRGVKLKHQEPSKMLNKDFDFKKMRELYHDVVASEKINNAEKISILRTMQLQTDEANDDLKEIIKKEDNLPEYERSWSHIHQLNIRSMYMGAFRTTIENKIKELEKLEG